MFFPSNKEREEPIIEETQSIYRIEFGTPEYYQLMNENGGCLPKNYSINFSRGEHLKNRVKVSEKCSIESKENKIAEYPLTPDECFDLGKFDEYLGYKKLIKDKAHPGEFIKWFIKIQENTKSTRVIAKEIGVSSATYVNIKNGKRPLTIKSAHKLDKYFKQEPNFFIDAQSNHTLSTS